MLYKEACLAGLADIAAKVETFYTIFVVFSPAENRMVSPEEHYRHQASTPT